MTETKKIEVIENIYDENERIADQTKNALSSKGVFCVNVMGAPGAGKTTSIINLIKHFKQFTPFVIEGDIESDLDTKTLEKIGIRTVQINTGGACHLDAPLIKNAISSLDPDRKGILFIENIGNLVCPAEFVIGEHIKVLVATVTEGSDKPYKYPLAFEKADALILNKVDLIPYLDFDLDYFTKGFRALNPDAPLFMVSGKTGEGYEEMGRWLEDRASKALATV
jgi:hydrogenase nickel incorporation protein HypB